MIFQKKHLFFAVLLALFFTLFQSCEDDNGGISIDRDTLEINKFIHDYMEVAYFWNQEMPDYNYQKEEDPEAYFYKLLKEPDDKWSFITDDIDALNAYFEGVQKTYGFSVQPYYLKKGSNQVVFFVEYVYRDSPAEEAGLKRGDMFYKINNQIITDQNYQDLISDETMLLTLGIADENGNVSELSPQLSLSAVVMNIHPIVARTTLDINGQKIGYLAYTAFRSNYDTALVNTFQRFKEENITDLVLDLRYNGGGDVSSAARLAGLIAPATSKGSVFITEHWNNEMTKYFLSENNNNEEIFTLRFPEEENNLNLARLFVLTTASTASASEMVIYGLAPYMNVSQIGEITHGKYYGSITISDPDKKHSWAIQPIVMRSENANNSINYAEGLPPVITLVDNYYNAPLGDPEEYFLSYALSEITGIPIQAPSLKAGKLLPQKIRGFKEQQDPLRQTMIISKPEE